MRAVELTADRKARVIEIARPEPGDGEVLVRVTSAGICGSDVSALAGHHPFRRPPLITGHEGGGQVVGVGPGVDEAWLGRHVALDPQQPCGRCEACAAGLTNLCRNRLMLGMAQWSGTLADYVVAPTSSLHPVADTVPSDLLALAEPLAVAHHAIDRVAVLDGLRVTVLGGGPIGALVCYLAHRRGAASITVTDPRTASRALCTTFGADLVLDPAEADPRPDQDVVFVAAAVDTLVDDAVARLVPRGTAVVVGLYGHPVTVDVAALQLDEKTITGSSVYTGDDVAAAVRLLEQDAALLATMAGPPVTLEDAASYLNSRVRGDPDDSIKVLVMPHEGA